VLVSFVLINAGPGRTVMLKVSVASPAQLSPLAFTVTVMVAVIGLPVVLVALNGGMLPRPLAGRPMSVLLLVQAKAAFGDGLENKIPFRTKLLLQKAVSLTATIRGDGLMVTLTESVVMQPTPVESVKT
jgi:hypothetical protein